MLNEPFWLTADEVIEYARLAVQVTGEPFFIRDRTMLESAVASPRNRWHYEGSPVPVLAATLLLSIARDHPFEQGNKRAALGSAKGFAELNGYELVAWDEAYADLIIAVLAREYDTEGFVARFAPTVRRFSSRGLRNSGFRLRKSRRIRQSPFLRHQ